MREPLAAVRCTGMPPAVAITPARRSCTYSRNLKSVANLAGAGAGRA